MSNKKNILDLIDGRTYNNFLIVDRNKVFIPYSSGFHPLSSFFVINDANALFRTENKESNFALQKDGKKLSIDRISYGTNFYSLYEEDIIGDLNNKGTNPVIIDKDIILKNLELFIRTSALNPFSSSGVIVYKNKYISYEYDKYFEVKSSYSYKCSLFKIHLNLLKMLSKLIKVFGRKDIVRISLLTPTTLINFDNHILRVTLEGNIIIDIVILLVLPRKGKKSLSQIRKETIEKEIKTLNNFRKRIKKTQNIYVSINDIQSTYYKIFFNNIAQKIGGYTRIRKFKWYKELHSNIFCGIRKELKILISL